MNWDKGAFFVDVCILFVLLVWMYLDRCSIYWGQ
jgi:hypothetical protein